MFASSTPPGLYWAAAVLAVLVMAAPVSAQNKNSDPLPLTKVVLFNSGVGFYQRSGEVEGNAEVDLKFNVDDVNACCNCRSIGVVIGLHVCMYD